MQPGSRRDEYKKRKGMVDASLLGNPALGVQGPGSIRVGMGTQKARTHDLVLWGMVGLAAFFHVTVLLGGVAMSTRARQADYAFFEEDVKIVEVAKVKMVEVPKTPPPPPPPPPPKQVTPPPKAAPRPVASAPKAAPSRPGGGAAPKAPVASHRANPNLPPQAALPVVASATSTGPAMAVGNGGGNPNGVVGGQGTGTGKGTGTGSGDGNGAGTGGYQGLPDGPLAATPFISWDETVGADGIRPPQPYEWGAYQANTAYQITGEAIVHMTLEVTVEGQLVGFNITRVELQGDNGVPQDKREAEARKYIQTILPPAKWHPAIVANNGQSVAYKGEDWKAAITMRMSQPGPGQ